jgi:hypothetical protein
MKRRASRRHPRKVKDFDKKHKQPGKALSPAERYRGVCITETSVAEKKNATQMRGVFLTGVSTGIRTPVLTVKG